MKASFKELRFHAMRQEIFNDNYSYEDLRTFLMEQATIRDEEKNARGSFRNINADTSEDGEEELGSWIGFTIGDWIWIDAG